jgi:hypothetical protein
MEAELKPNELYRGYTIVNMVENPGEVRIMGASGEYIEQHDFEPATFTSFDYAKTWLDAQIRNGLMFAIDNPRTKAVVGDNGLQLVVNTPGGDIVVKSCGDTPYRSRKSAKIYKFESQSAILVAHSRQAVQECLNGLTTTGVAATLLSHSQPKAVSGNTFRPMFALPLASALSRVPLALRYKPRFTRVPENDCSFLFPFVQTGISSLSRNDA